MKTLKKSLLAFAIPALGLGVVMSSPADEHSAAQTTTDEASATELQKESREAWEALKDYTVEQRDQVVEQANRMLADLDARIDKLQAKIEAQSATAQEQMKAQWQQTLATLRERRIAAAEWLGSLRHGSKDAWEEIKGGFGRAYSDLYQAFQEAETEVEAAETKSQ